jgi:hypothetical protein
VTKPDIEPAKIRQGNVMRLAAETRGILENVALRHELTVYKQPVHRLWLAHFLETVTAWYVIALLGGEKAR